MTDLNALLAAVRRNPAADAPRLAIADWLDEHPEPEPCPTCRGGSYCPKCSGEGCSPYGVAANGPCYLDRCPECGVTRSVPDGRAAWAELIRVGCELAKLPCSHPWRNGEPYWWDAEPGRMTPGHRCVCFTARVRERTLLPLAAPLLSVRLVDGVPYLDVGECPGCAHWSDDTAARNAAAGYVCTHCLRYPGRRLLRCEVRRGLVARVEVPTLAELVGERCENCEGEGTIESGRYENAREPCPDCGGQWESRDEPGDLGYSPGTGHLPGLAPVIGRLAPGVEEVAVGDRVPRQSTRNGKPLCWWVRGTNDQSFEDRAVVPRCIWEAGGFGYGQFDATAAAQTALARAAAAYCRGLAQKEVV